MPVLTWDDAHRQFEIAMERIEANILDEDYESGDNALKNYLLEVDGAARGNYERKVQFLRAVTSKIFRKAEVAMCPDPSLMVLRVAASVYKRTRKPEEVRMANPQVVTAETAELYVDCSDDRFWKIYTISASEASDYVIGYLADKTAYLDRAWLPRQMLTNLPQGSILREARLDFNNTAVTNHQGEFDGRAIEEIDVERAQVDPALDLRFDLRFKTNNSVLVNRAIAELEQSPFFSQYVSLSHLQVKRFSNPKMNAYTKTRVFYSGKMSARGTSYSAHQEILDYVYRGYQRSLIELERNYGMGVNRMGNSLALTGAPLVIEFGRQVDDPVDFADRLVKEDSPFRLSGITDSTSPEFARLRAIDLHVNKPMDIEISPSNLTIYLRRGSCGNSVLRLFANLQRHFDSSVKLYGGDGVAIF